MGILDVVLPSACTSCGRSGALLCSQCLDACDSPSKAADRFLAPDAAVVVGESLSLALAAFTHAGPVRRALAAMKYSGAARLAPILVTAAVPTMRQLLAMTGRAALVPVPLHRERRRARGYNQAELLARQLARLADLPLADALVRARPTTKQHRLNRAARLQNLRRAFVMRPGARAPQIAILVDDIITTTATLEACAGVLREAGSLAVFGFAVAREV